MKLLFDQNLSPRLVAHLADVFPASSHVFSVGLDRSPDQAVWAYARDHQFLLVTKDADFSEMSTLHGFPPKVIWLRLGNRRTAQVDASLRLHLAAIRHLAESDALAFISLVS